MNSLFFYIAATEGNRQVLAHLNGSGPDGDPVVETPGRLARLINRFQRAAVNRPAARRVPAAITPGEESGETGLRPSGASSSR